MLGFNKSRKLTKKDLAGALPDEFSLREEWFEIEGLGQVLLREMNAGQRDEWEWLQTKREVVEINEKQKAALEVDDDQVCDPRGIRSFLVVRCLVEPSNGELMFCDNDRHVIDSLPISILDRLYVACLELCGLRIADFEHAKKNSAMTSTSADSSGSPAAGENPLPS